ncbi:MAG: hypothetical protein ACYC8S_02275 [Minisyncoccota bacterium]
MKRAIALIILVVFLVGGIVFVGRYLFLHSGYYIDKTFSNKINDNKQHPVVLEGQCFGGIDLLSARIVNETDSSLLFQVQYCNESPQNYDQVDLGINALGDTGLSFGVKPGSVMAGYGSSLVRLFLYGSTKSATTTAYELYLYNDRTGEKIVGYPFQYIKRWCVEEGCK